jgi:zinc transporter, ZIP family
MTSAGKLSLYARFRSKSSPIQFLIAVSSLLFIITSILSYLYFFINPIIAYGSLASILAGLATGVGALPALLFREIKQKLLFTLLGGAAGVMLAATSFSLVVPGIHYGNEIWPGKGVVIMAIGILGGALFLELSDRFLPLHRFLLQREDQDGSLRKIWLFIGAIALHNFPEGAAVGISFGSGDWHNGVALAIAVALQNIPEGLAVALPLIGFGYQRRQAVLIAALTGLVEPLGGFLGVSAVSAFYPLLSGGMAFAAGAMLFVISDDIIPRTQSQGKSRSATFALLIGFVIMMMLDNMLV